MSSKAILGLALAVASLGAGCGNGPEAMQAAVQRDEIIDGYDVAADNSGFAIVNGGCSGTLLTNTWVLTAKHCNTAVGSSVRMGAQTRAVDLVVNHPSVDATVARLSSPMTMNGSTTSYRARLRGDALAAGTSVRCFGYGYNTYSGGFGTLRTATMTVASVSGTDYYFQQNGVGQIQWLGDSGGGCLDDANRALYVQSVCWHDGVSNVSQCAGPRADAIALWADQAMFGSFLQGPAWERDATWCSHSGAQLFIGDFNGDGREDMLCHDTAGYKWIDFADANGQFNGTEWERNAAWCNHSGAQLLLGDFNGDGRKDMLCHDTAGHKWIDYADVNGQFNGTDWERDARWCSHAGAQLFLGDFNGDGRDDFLCHDTAGHKWIDYADANGQFNGTDWERDARWCSHDGSQFFLGDFNGDGRDDFLCHDSNGHKWTDLADGNGQFTGTDWELDAHWCGHAGSQLFVDDFNGDGKDDLLCHDAAGRKWFDFASASGRFFGTDFYRDANWCSHATGRLFTGTFNSDRRADVMCHDVSTGYKWVAQSGL